MDVSVDIDVDGDADVYLDIDMDIVVGLGVDVDVDLNIEFVIGMVFDVEYSLLQIAPKLYFGRIGRAHIHKSQ